MKHTAEVAVVGGGASGLVAAIALAAAGSDTVLFAPPAGTDRRTTALLDGSVRVLRALGVWDRIAPRAAPLAKLRIVDATRRLLRTPEILFDAAELELEAFGFNVENEILRRELLDAVRRSAKVRLTEQPVTSVVPDADNVILHSGEGREDRARLIVAADGRNSLCRSAAGIATSRRAFPQTALALSLRHRRSHRNISTEFHTETGPFTLVPLEEDMGSSLVWVVRPHEADAFLALSDAELGREAERRAHSMLGAMAVDGGRGSFPIAVEIAERLAARRIALIGEAGHVLPPIGAQGLNLGIRDAATVAELVADARRIGDDVGGDVLLEDYESRRRPDVRRCAVAVELMNRSLLTDFLPVHALRGFGLDVASRFGFARRALMRQGLGPFEDDAPRLARGEAI